MADKRCSIPSRQLSPHRPMEGQPLAGTQTYVSMYRSHYGLHTGGHRHINRPGHRLHESRHIDTHSKLAKAKITASDLKAIFILNHKSIILSLPQKVT